jgi:long-chain acyl-CoA synthetase
MPDGAPVIEVPLLAVTAAAHGLEAAPSGVPGTVGYEQAIDDHDPWTEPAEAPPMSIIYTSGTTGRPKGILRRPSSDQAGLLAMISQVLGLGPGRVTLQPAPMYHTAPNVHSIFSVALGMDQTLMPRFDPEAFLALVERHRVTTVQMVPTMFVRLLKLPAAVRERYDVSSLREIVHAAAPCPVDVKQAMIDWFGPIVTEYYGGSESGPVVLCTSEQWLRHPGTVGAPLPGADVRIYPLDAEPGTLDGALGACHTGEIYLRPPPSWPQFTYHDNPDGRSAIARGEYFTQGDVGYQDEDGYLFLTDRAIDMIVSGGVNIYPAEIEACLIARPEVRDAAVFGVPDEQYGESVAAHLELQDGAVLTEDDVRAHVRDTLAGYKVPRVVVFDDALPREDTGKLFKRRIRDRYWQGRERAI